MAKNDQLKTPSVLAFERKLDPSDGIFTAGRWELREQSDSWPVVALREKSVRGTQSSRVKTKGKDPAKLNPTFTEANLQRVDTAMLPNDCDTLRMRFTLRVLGRLGVPNTCTSRPYAQRLGAAIASYVEAGELAEVARRYAHNIASARYLWRNRPRADEIEVTVREVGGGQVRREWRFDASTYSLNGFSGSDGQLRELAEVIEKGLGSTGGVYLEVIAHARIGDGQEVYPSQEMILDRSTSRANKSGSKSKVLYSTDWMGEQTAAMHSQKVGNALRTIDDWYPQADSLGRGPIPVEPFGSVTHEGEAYRAPQTKQDFYTLLDAWMLRDEKLDAAARHFVVATIIRGGVFGESSDKGE